jgi:hypothetical protein
VSSRNIRNVSFIFRKLIFYDLIDKRKPITGMGCLEFTHMNQEQTFQLILTLISRGIVEPEDIEKFIQAINAKCFKGC